MADLLADLIGPAQSEWSGGTPAKVANPAKNRASIDAAGDSRVCVGLRKVANSQADQTTTAPDSQKFAGLRSGGNRPQSEHPCGFSQDSQNSQGVAGTKEPAHARAMVAAHLAETPDAADEKARHPPTEGLPKPTKGAFGSFDSAQVGGHRDFSSLIGGAANEPAHARGCTANGKVQARVAERGAVEPNSTNATPTRPYKLTPVEADAAHAEPWNDEAIARFVARVSLILRRGINATDADDIAERLHLRDVHDDGRVLCVECRHLVRRAGYWRCGNHRTADAGRELPAVLTTTMQRCMGFGA